VQFARVARDPYFETCAPAGWAPAFSGVRQGAAVRLPLVRGAPESLPKRPKVDLTGVASMHDASPYPRLSAAQIEAFFEIGYVRIDGVFSPREVGLLRAACDRLRATAESLAPRPAQADSAGLRAVSRLIAAPLDSTCAPTPVLHKGAQFVLGRGPAGRPRIDRIVWCGAAEPSLLESGRDPRLLHLAAQLLGAKGMQQLINQVHFKLPGDGVEFPWHQDSSHRRYGTPDWSDVNGRGSYVQVVTAVDDCGLDNGPLLFVAGSSRHGHIAVEPGAPLPAHYVESDRIQAVTMPAGSVVLFGPYTIHGSTPNLSNRSRRLFINGFAALGANRRVYPGEGSGRIVEAP